MKTRLIVCPLIRNNKGEYLICKMPKTRGAFPNQWALPGGGVEPGEMINEALLREIREELGDKLEFSEIIPWTFRDDLRRKLYKDGSSEQVYMIYLIFDCLATNDEIIINDEFDEFNWVKKDDLSKYDLNEATKLTFKQKGIL